MAFNCVLRWTLLPLLSYSAFAFDDSVHMKSQWLQKGLEFVNLRSAAMVDMNNNFTLLFGGISYNQIPGNTTYAFAYNQYPGFNTKYSWRILKHLKPENVPTSRRLHELVRVRTGEVLLFGGECYNGNYMPCSKNADENVPGLHWRFVSNISTHNEEKGFWRRDVKFVGRESPGYDLTNMAIAELNDRGLFVVYGGRNVVYGPAGEKNAGPCLTDTWVGYYESNGGNGATVTWKKISGDSKGNPGVFFLLFMLWRLLVIVVAELLCEMFFSYYSFFVVSS